MPKIEIAIERPPKELVEEFRKLPVAALSDAMGRSNTMVADIKPMFNEVKIAGSAITVREMVGCNLMIHKSVQIAQAGDAIVIDARGHRDTAVGGALLCLAAKQKGVEAIVVDGSWRDATEIRKMRFPVFVRAVVPNGPHKGWPGDINVPIQCGGVNVSPGDIVVGDDDGVVVVPKDEAQDVLKETKSILTQEERMKDEILKGKSTVELLGIDEKLSKLGVKV